MDQLTTAQIAACQQTSTALQAEAQRTGVPAGWHVITVCDEAGWQTIVSLRVGATQHALRANQATNGRLHLMFVHGSQVRATDTEAIDAVLLQAASTPRSPALTGIRMTTDRPVLTPTSLRLPTPRR